MHPAEYREGQRESLTVMDYSFWERLTGSKFIARGELTPRCDRCRTRIKKRGAPRLFLLPIIQDKDYTPSAEYYSMACWPIPGVESIPVGRRACRMWPLACPECGTRAVLVVDFLLVRGQEVPEKTVVCEYAPLAGLLDDAPAEAACADSEKQAFRYEQSD